MTTNTSDPVIQRPTHTAGPWGWRELGGHYSLVARHSGTLIVLDAVRQGMQGATIRLARLTDNMGGLMVPVRELDLRTHPDARLIRSAPTLFAAARRAAAFLANVGDGEAQLAHADLLAALAMATPAPADASDHRKGEINHV